MTELLAIDPGRVTGWAFFKDGQLRSAGSTKTVGGVSFVARGFTVDCDVLIELPQHVAAPVMDLITLAVRVGELKREFESKGCKVELVWPTTWKRNTPKDVMNRRALAALGPAELAFVPRRPRAKDIDHNVADAIGIGLWKLGRLR